jgi:hypothetical protein
MIGFLEIDSIRDVFFLAVRFVVALAGFAVGYFLTGPIVQGGLWLIRRRTLPDWQLGIVRVVVGILVALIVFYLVPIGGNGWGGAGSGGGQGDGQGPGKGTQGSGTGTTSDKKSGPGQDTGPTDKRTASTLVVEMLGPTTAEGDKCYRLDKKSPPLNWEALKGYIEMQQARITAIEILITEQSVSRSDPLVEQLRQLAEKLMIPTRINAS